MPNYKRTILAKRRAYVPGIPVWAPYFWDAHDKHMFWNAIRTGEWRKPNEQLHREMTISERQKFLKSKGPDSIYRKNRLFIIIF